MKIAYCLYGQPRMAQRGHDNIAAFVQNTSVDFFIHMWHDTEKTHFDSSPWRSISAADLQIDKGAVPFVLDAYRPVSCQIEKPRTIDLPGIRESIMFQNSDEATRANLNNTLSQMYSKQCVRDLLSKRAHEYDLVIASRFDFVNPIRLNLATLQKDKLYIADFRLPQVIFPDNFVVSTPDMFLRTFNAYADLGETMNDRALHHTLNVHGEHAVMVTENILLATFLKHFSVKNHVVFTQLIPDFH